MNVQDIDKFNALMADYYKDRAEKAEITLENILADMKASGSVADKYEKIICRLLAHYGMKT